jgi:hypothetical protein
VDFSKNRHLDGDEVRVRLPFGQAFEDLILPSAVRFFGGGKMDENGWRCNIWFLTWKKKNGPIQDAKYWKMM